MKVVVITEDHTLNQYIAKPVVEEIFRECGKSPRIMVVNNLRIRGWQQALDQDTIHKNFENIVAADLFLLIIDRDCDENRESGIVAARLADAELMGKTMFACLTMEEVEIWALSIHRQKFRDPWRRIRQECKCERVYVEPFVKQKNQLASLEKGRFPVMRDLHCRWDSLKSFCPEVQVLVDQVQEWLAAG